MEFEASLLEEWMRRFYFDAVVDIGSSGVEDFAFGEVRELCGLSASDLDAVVLRDSTSYGHDELRRAIAARYGNGDPRWVMATHGASEAIYLAVTALVEPGDEVVALQPAYHSHTSVARACGATTTTWRLSAETGFEPDFDELRDVVGPQTRAVVVNFPHNPTGATITPAQQRELVSIVEDAGAYLVWDAAFAELVHTGDRLPDPTTLSERAVSVGTFSKAFGLPGLRFGWCLAHPDVLARMVHLRDRMTLHLSPLVELVARRVVEHADRVLASRRRLVRRNLDLVTEWAAANGDRVALVPPKGGPTAFPRFVGYPDTEPLCFDLGVRRRVLLVPGVCFGDPERVRLGFGGPTRDLERGLAVVAETLRSPTNLPVVEAALSTQ